MSISLPSLASWIIFITIIVVGNSIIILYILGSHKLFVFYGLLGTCFLFLHPQYHGVGVWLSDCWYTLYSGLMTRYEIYIFSKEASSRTDVSRRHWDYTHVSYMTVFVLSDGQYFVALVTALASHFFSLFFCLILYSLDIDVAAGTFSIELLKSEMYDVSSLLAMSLGTIIPIHLLFSQKCEL